MGSEPDVEVDGEVVVDVSVGVLRAPALRTPEYERGRAWSKAFLAGSEAAVAGDVDGVERMIAECERIGGVGDLAKVVVGEFGAGVSDQVAFAYQRAFGSDA